MTEQNNIKYQNLGQVAAMGDNARVEVVNQTQGESKTINFGSFLEELKQLRKGIEEDSQASEDEKDAAIVVIQNAKEAAKAEDQAGAIASLKKGSKWLLGLAEKLSVQIVAGIIRDHLHG